uniref:Uncharacterized protein n=1 Tax=Sphaerodactylus townsendi TaxID=933632 RepID=A0ACB8EGC2_9SAUR
MARGGDGKMKDVKGKRLQEDEEDFEPQVELHFTILEESEGGISQGKLWHCDVNAELQPDSSSLPDPEDESVYSDRTRSPSPERQRFPPAPERGARDRRMGSYPQPGPKQQVELHFTILEESEGGISEGRLCASEISSDEPLEIDYPKCQRHGPAQFGQPMFAANDSPPAKGMLEGETKGEVAQPGSADQQVEVQLAFFEDSEEVSLSQGPEDYPMCESPFTPDMYQGDYPKDYWDASIDSLANVVPATILDSDNLVTYFWGDEETDAGLEPVPTQLIYSGAD